MTLQPNLLGKKKSPRHIRALQGGVFIAALLLGVMSWQLWEGYRGTLGAASLYDATGATPAASASPVPAVSRAPKPVSTDAVNSLAVSARGDAFRFYEAKTGRAFSYAPASGRTETLSDAVLKGFIESAWVPGADRVISAFDEKGTKVYRAFDYATSETTPLGTQVSAVAVAPDGRQAVYAEAKELSTDIVLSDVSGAGPRKLLSTRADGIRLSWPAGDRGISMISRRAGHAGDDLTLIAPDGKISQLLSGREDLEILWSPDGRSLLYSYFVPDEGVALFILNRGSSSEYPLGVATSARKCAWHPSGASIVCGIPAKTALARGVPANQMATTDDIIGVDLLTGRQTVYFKISEGTLLSVIDPVVSPSGDFLAFVNLFDRRLYALELR